MEFGWALGVTRSVEGRVLGSKRQALGLWLRVAEKESWSHVGLTSDSCIHFLAVRSREKCSSSSQTLVSGSIKQG